MKATIEHLFDNLYTASNKKGTEGLLESIFHYNPEQSEAKTQTLAQAALFVMRNKPGVYPAEAVQSFPKYHDDLGEDANCFWMGGWDVWEAVYPKLMKLLLKEKVDLEELFKQPAESFD